MSLLLQKAGTPYTGQDFRNIVGSIDGGNADFRTAFQNSGHVPSLKIPHQSICEDQLKIIDSCKYCIAINQIFFKVHVHTSTLFTFLHFRGEPQIIKTVI